MAVRRNRLLTLALLVLLAVGWSAWVAVSARSAEPVVGTWEPVEIKFPGTRPRGLRRFHHLRFTLREDGTAQMDRVGLPIVHTPGPGSWQPVPATLYEIVDRPGLDAIMGSLGQQSDCIGSHEMSVPHLEEALARKVLQITPKSQRARAYEIDLGPPEKYLVTWSGGELGIRLGVGQVTFTRAESWLAKAWRESWEWVREKTWSAMPWRCHSHLF